MCIDLYPILNKIGLRKYKFFFIVYYGFGNPVDMQLRRDISLKWVEPRPGGPSWTLGRHIGLEPKVDRLTSCLLPSEVWKKLWPNTAVTR
jgi:hypothetical protein